MTIKESEKTYIECRILILGEKNVGKKSFINRLINLSSTSIIRNYESEIEFNKNILLLSKKIEEEEEFIRETEKEKYRGIRFKNDSSTLGNKSLTKKSSVESKDMTYSKENEHKKKDENNNNNINAGYKINFLPYKIAKSKIYHRPPIPEFPSKLFNIYKTKMIFKPYFISPAENLLYDSKPKDEDDSDYDFEKENKLTMKGIKNDINKIMEINKTVIELDKLYGYKINIYYIFLFLYDMTDYSSFETLLKYFDRLNTKYEITNRENIISCIIGNKKDRNILFNEKQLKTLNEFINKYKLKHYEISTKPFYSFPKFFAQFIIDNLSPMHEEFKENNFKEELKKLIINKSNFSKALRSPISLNEKNPGFEYDLNIYSYNSIKEVKEAMMNKKTRFKRKIFVNKQGPIIYNPKNTKEIIEPDKKFRKNFMNVTSGGILNKPIIGYTFGITEGKLNLFKSRRDLNRKRNKDIAESLDRDFTLNIKTDSIKIKPETYFDEASTRKNELLNQRILERQMKLEKIFKIHKDNLDRIAAEKEAQNSMINPKIKRSSSAPDFDLINKNKKRYYNVVYGKNKDYLNKFHKRRLEIEKQKIREEKERIRLIEKEREKQKEMEIEKEKEKSNEIRRKEKFRIGTIKIKPTLENKTVEQIVNYPVIKDDFEILLEKNKKRNQVVKIDFKPRFEEITKEKINNPYNDEEIWKKWELNKKYISKRGRLKNFLEKRKEKEKEQKINMKIIEKRNEEIKQIRREILIEKGYEDPLKIKEINYSQVEESAPKYTIKGRNFPRRREFYEDTNNFLLGQDSDVINYIKSVQMERPLPDINTIKPKMPNVIFSKAERFLNYNKSCENYSDLFTDGIFAPKTQENFNSKGTFTRDKKRSLAKWEKSPSPSDYKIKSSFEIIVEKGKNISDIRKRNKINDEIEKENRRKFILERSKEKEKEMEKGKEIEKEDNNSNIKN